jgi:Protein of unknown function (DUF1254)
MVLQLVLTPLQISVVPGTCIVSFKLVRPGPAIKYVCTRRAEAPASTQSEPTLPILPASSPSTAQMHLHNVPIVLVALLFGSGRAQSTEQNATAFALLYGYPLLAFEKLAPSILDLVGVNKIVHARVLATAANRTVVKPNVDTLYSTMIFDLSQANVVITVPDIPADQFHLFSYYDPSVSRLLILPNTGPLILTGTEITSRIQVSVI